MDDNADENEGEDKKEEKKSVARYEKGDKVSN